MLDLILRLIDRCIDLAKRKEQTRRNLFTDFAAPAFNDFEILHKSYLETFRSYRSMIETATNFTELKEELDKKINVDSMFSTAERSKVWELEKWVNDPEIGEFILAIIRYIRFDSRWRPPIKLQDGLGILTISDGSNITDAFRIPFANITRMTLRETLFNILEESGLKEHRRQSALKSLDSMVDKMQFNYAVVIHEYIALKDKMLRAI